MNIYHFRSNQIASVKYLFFNELNVVYSKEELEILFIRVVESLGYEFNSVEYLNQSDLIVISKIIDELKTGKPLAYILGYTYFYNLKFLVNKSVLIPRPETEELVWNLKNILQNKFDGKKPIKILDIGTGSGCIAITLKKLFPEAKVWAIDVSKEALELAQKNAELNGIEVFFEHKDILIESLDREYDIIVSNPPYIPIVDKEMIDDRVKKFEPHIALFSQTAIEFYERILDLSKTFLEKGGIAFLELNQYYAKDIKNLCEKFMDIFRYEIKKDWSGNDRFLLIEKL
ncbi:MAG: release factor glutamine methyltransferase [Bacteroidia bacterium]|nr:MAG: release factor glutamine methyltransferase [Bacteroidia bacterium]